jgi:hypothetical protein
MEMEINGRQKFSGRKLEERIFNFSRHELDPFGFQHVASRYTDWNIPAYLQTAFRISWILVLNTAQFSYSYFER